MTKTDIAPPKSRKLVKQSIGAVDKRRRPRGLTRAIKSTIDAIVLDRRTRLDACKTAGITERALYLALEKPEVARYWNAMCVVLRTGERAHNIHSLVDVRDASGNAMARVQAAKALEAIADAGPPPGAPAAVSPGLVIVIQNGDGTRTSLPQSLDVTPNEHGGDTIRPLLLK